MYNYVALGLNGTATWAKQLEIVIQVLHPFTYPRVLSKNDRGTRRDKHGTRNPSIQHLCVPNSLEIAPGNETEFTAIRAQIEKKKKCHKRRSNRGVRPRKVTEDKTCSAWAEAILASREEQISPATNQPLSL